MNEQWNELKETIVEIRDNNTYENEDVTNLCRFLANYMGILEDQIQEPCDNAISRNDMLDAIGHGTIYTSEKLQKIIKGLPDVKTIGIQDSMLIPTIKSKLDNLDTYTIHMGASQTDKVCVEFKEVVKILEKYRKGGRNES